MKKLKLCFLILLISSLNCHAGLVKNMYDSLLKYKVYEPEISLCIIIQETFWLKCTNCTLDDNNFFAFLWKGKYKEFRDYKHAIVYYKTWQVKWWLPYKKRNPNKSYYDFLAYINYAPDMKKYNNDLKIIKIKIKNIIK